MLDGLEALEIGRRLGERVILFGTSTGATVIAEVLAREGEAQDIAGAALVSPNFRIADPNAPLHEGLVPLLTQFITGSAPAETTAPAPAPTPVQSDSK